jgi:hypothetical protein
MVTGYPCVPASRRKITRLLLILHGDTEKEATRYIKIHDQRSLDQTVVRSEC